MRLAPVVAAAAVLIGGRARAGAPVRAQDQQVVAPMRGAGDMFGASVAVDGDLAVIGAPQRAVGPYANAGQAYLLLRSAGAWAITGTLEEPSTIGPNRDLARTTALRGDRLVLGAPGFQQSRGAAHVFAYDAALGWVPQIVLVSPEGVAGDRFAVAVDVAGGLVLAGETVQSLPAMDMIAGEVHVFDEAAAWARTQVLKPLDAEGGDRFGFSLATAGALAVVGAPGKEGGRGAAYVFTYAGAWTQAAKLVIAGDRVPGDFFGYSVAIEGERVVVGAHGRNAGVGAVYVFAPVADKWTQVQEIVPEVAMPGEAFGARVTLADGRILVSGWGFESVANVGGRGGAYLYGSGPQGFVPLAALRADDGVPGDYLAIGAAISKDAILLGAPYDDAPTQPALDLSKALGSAYVFAVAQGSGQPCAIDADCTGDQRCCESACAAFSECEVAPTSGDISLTEGGTTDATSTGAAPGTSESGAPPEVVLDPLADGCGCGAGGRAGGWLGLLLLAWRRRR